MAYGFFVIGSIELGPVEPLHPPSIFEQITKYLLVSIGLPGPIIGSHHPVSESSEILPATCAFPVRAWHINIALSFLLQFLKVRFQETLTLLKYRINPLLY